MNNVRNFGAVGDGVTLDTQAIQKALDAGGIVYFPAGVYLTGSIYLRSNGGLELAPGATLLAVPDKTQYNADDFIPENQAFSTENVSGAHLVIAANVENIVIRGGGRIDGNRRAVFNTPNPENPARFLLPEWRMGQMVYIVNSKNVNIQDVEMLDSQYWTCFLHGCQWVKIRGVRIENDFGTQNGDGIDVDCCCYVTISDCIIRSADDSITLRGNDARLGGRCPCEYVTITNCILSTRCNAFRIGVGGGLVRRCTISNVIVRDTRTAICLVSQYSKKSMGVQIEDIQFSNLRLDCVRPFYIATTPRGMQEETAKNIERISFHHVRGTANRGSVISGSYPGYVKDISFSDVKIVYDRGENIVAVPPEKTGYGEFVKGNPPAAFYLCNAEDVEFKDVKVTYPANADEWLAGIMNQNSSYSCNKPISDKPDIG